MASLRTPIQYQPKPYVLHSNVMMFHDWRYIHEGTTRWTTADGGRIERYPDSLPETPMWAGDEMPLGIKLRALPSETSEPFIEVDKPWEDFLRHSTVVYEGGIYRIWYSNVKYMCYAESDDGIMWRKPELGIREFDGNTTNNIVIGTGIPPEPDYFNLGNVFVDPTAPPEEKYKALYTRSISRKVASAFTERYPDDVSPQYQEGADPDLNRKIMAIGGAVSADGVNWKPYSLPLGVHRADTQNIAYYDRMLKKYVAYFRTHVFRRRSIGRAESENFAHFPLPDTIIWPDPSMDPSEVYYGIGRMEYPGAPDYHLLFTQQWRVTEDTWTHRVAASPDGVLWGFLPGDSDVIKRGEGRAWNAGAIEVGAGMVDLLGNRVGFPITEYDVPHKHPRLRGLGKIAWVSWPRDRIIALQADQHGQFTTKKVRLEGNTLRINVRTKHVGSIAIEVLGNDNQPIEGRSFADCDHISGDYMDKLLTWRGNPSLGRTPNEPLAFRVKLSFGQLFSMRFQ
jgi:hypothetical protein